MKVVIIEDESLIAKNLQRLLHVIDPAVEILAVIESVADAVKWFNSNPHPDLVFMDIQLSDGVSFDIFEKVKIEKPVIFTTAYNEYAIQAFKVNSVDYLLKPIDKDYLAAAIEKYHKYFGKDTSVMGEQLQAMIASYTAKVIAKYKERFLAHYKNGIVPIHEDKICHFIKDSIIYLITTDGEKLVTDYNTIDEIEELVNPDKFFRANRQMIVHINCVENYRKHHTGKLEVHLKNQPNLTVDVSREKASDFIDWLEK